MYNENLNHLTREKLNVGTVPTFDFFNIETGTNLAGSACPQFVGIFPIK